MLSMWRCESRKKVVMLQDLLTILWIQHLNRRCTFLLSVMTESFTGFPAKAFPSSAKTSSGFIKKSN